MVKLGTVELGAPLALAPMAGVTDVAFRAVCRAQGAGYTVTEMVSAKALLYQDKKTRELLRREPGDAPMAVQLFGRVPEELAQAARKARELTGCELIDLNMGCPTGKIVRNGEGCALMRDPPLAKAIVAAVVRAVDVPVTVKLRKGWDKGSVNAVELARAAEEEGAAAICIHGRTRVQLYSGRADWDVIRDVKRSVRIPVAANGDVFEPEDAVRILRHTGADFAMAGRGALGNPWLFARAAAALAGQPIPPLPPVARRLETALEQFHIALTYKGEKIACLEARKHLCWYLRGVAYAGYFKEQITKLETAKETERLVRIMQAEL